tara:strand:+ start:8019 stop:8399 length:381 start_codon:yes stop_codon:yes gene_type:complete
MENEAYSFKEVYIEKFDATDQPRCLSAKSVQEYRDRMMTDDVSPNVGYNVRGMVIMHELEVGGFINVNRTHRNGEEVRGFFRSSRIEDIEYLSEASSGEEAMIIHTGNSIYSLLFVDKDDKIGTII